MFIQTEDTPNPATIKFLPGQTVMEEGTAEFKSANEAGSSALARQLFLTQGVKTVFFSGDYISVTWDFGDGSSIVSGDVVSHQYLNPGEYTVTQTVEYAYGCVDTYSEQIEVTDGYDIVLPTAFSPNNDGINDTMRPVYACVNSIEMSIYDTFGSLIYYENNLELNGWDGSLDGKLAENGNYLIVVKGTTIYNEEINLRGVFVLLR